MCSAVLSLIKETSCWNTEGTSSAKKKMSGGKEYIMMHLKFSCLSFATTENSSGMYKCLMYMFIDN